MFTIRQINCDKFIYWNYCIITKNQWSRITYINAGKSHKLTAVEEKYKTVWNYISYDTFNIKFKNKWQRFLQLATFAVTFGCPCSFIMPMETAKLIHSLILISTRIGGRSLWIARHRANWTKQKVKNSEPSQSGDGWRINELNKTAYNFSGQCSLEIRIPWEPFQQAFVPEEKQSGKNNNSFGEKTVCKKQDRKPQAQQMIQNTCSSFSVNYFISMGPSVYISTYKITRVYEVICEQKIYIHLI